MVLTQQEIDHYQFVLRTDRKSIFKQIQELVKTGKNIAFKELKQRRLTLQRMLEQEDRIYQEEFAKKVKTRIDEDIKQRKIQLLQIKEERKRQHQEFLQEKKIQREIVNCYEIREALKHNETMQVQETQLEQIVEKERAFKRKLELDEYWRKVDKVNEKRYDQCLELEQRMKRDLQRNTCQALEEQIAYNKRKQEEECELKRQERRELEQHMKDLQIEERDNIIAGMTAKALAYRNELLDEIAKRKTQREAEKCKEIKEDLAQMRKLAKEEEEERAALAQRKRAVYNATMEYIDYARRMHKLEKDTQAMRDARINDLRHVDYCTKVNMKAEMRRRAEMASIYYAELRQQMCQEYERRMREAAELREQKILENRFVHPEKSDADIRKERRKLREELDKQLADNERVRKEEELRYNLELQKLSNDHLFCEDFAEKYINERQDFLPLHPNWVIYACPKKEYVGKRSVAVEDGGSGAAGGAECVKDTCIRPCGCETGMQKSCRKHSFMSEIKRAPNAEIERKKREEC